MFMKEKNNFSRDLMYVNLIFVLGVLVHFYFADFPKSLEVYPDELRYYGIAHSLYNGNGLSLRGIGTDFQKLAYAVLLTPFFSIQNVFVRIRVISFVNCIVMMLSVFPVWMIAREVGLKRKSRYLIIILCTIWPDTMLTMTFMSENLYWPIFLLFYYLWILNERKRKISITITNSVLCYIGYFCKEIFLSVFLAYILYEIVYPFVISILYKREVRKVKNTYFDNEKIKNIVVFVCIFLLCHVITKVTIFTGLGNSYNQMGISAILDWYNFGYMFYGFLYYVAALLISVLFLPFIYPALKLKIINDITRKFYCHIILFLGNASAIIAYTIMVREELGRTVPRIHLRYVGPAIFLLIIIFFVSIQDTSNTKENLKTRDFMIIGIVFLFGCIVFKGVLYAWVDQQQLNWYVFLQQEIGILKDKNSNMYTIYTYAIIANILLGVIVFSFSYLYMNRSKLLMGKIFWVIILIFCLINDYISKEFVFQAMAADEIVVSEIINMNHYFNQQEDKKILYLTDKLEKQMDTWFDKMDNLCFVNRDEIIQLEIDDSIKVSEMKFSRKDMGK